MEFKSMDTKIMALGWIRRKCDDQTKKAFYNTVYAKRKNTDKMIFSMDEFEQVMSRFELLELVKMGQVNRDFDIFDAWFRNQGFILSSSDEFEYLMDEGGWAAVLDDCSWYDVPSRLKSLIRLWDAE